MRLITLITAFTLAFVLLPFYAHADDKAQLTQKAPQPQPTKEALDNLKPFPEKLEGMDRFVIYVTPQDNEDALQVELIPGKVMEVDCNRHRLLGQLSEKNLEGWGYTYYTFTAEERVASTLMACPGPKTEQFVQAESLMTRYNSRLPIVVYVQQGYTLQYRIWSAGPEQQAEKH